jgi:glycosyltransferase involved in cell wall biosynthesis
MNLLMVSGNGGPAEGKLDAFHNMLAEFSKYWDRIDIICPSVKENICPSPFPNVFFHPSPWKKLWQPFHIAKVGARLARERNYDLITIQEYAPFLHGIGGNYLAAKTKIPFVSEFHHIEGYPKAADFTEVLRRFMSGIYARWVSKRALRLRVVNGNETPQFLRAHGVPEEKLLRLYSFYLQLDVFTPLNVAKEFDMVFCGRLVKNKGLFELLQATKILTRDFPDLRFLIIGTGGLEQKLKAFAGELGIEKNVVFHGWAKDNREIASLLNRSRVFVLTSYAEGGPRTPLEAMACGIPVVTTPVGLMKELIKDGENGLLINWDPAFIAKRVSQLLKDADKRFQLGRQGKKSVSIFNYSDIIRQYAQGYQSLLMGMSNVRT